jgi:hypothetical protein
MEIDTQLPKMAPVAQRFPALTVHDVPATVRRELERAGLAAAIRPGARVAVCVGSRGICGIEQIVRTVASALEAAGAKPFILPAMGSHGGATAEGQKRVLAAYGVTAQSVGCPVEATMDVAQVDALEDGTPVLVNRLALESDGIVLINRIKPHTSFRGRFESGLMKMMTIGLGSHRGATIAHAHPWGLARLIPAWGTAILRRAPVRLGLAIIENAYDQTARLEALLPEQFEPREPELLLEARQAMARLLFRDLDVLVVEQIGKDISGTGMDTNVIGRMLLPGVAEPAEPGVRRIVCLGLTPKTHGNANGVGLADIVTRRLFARIDYKSTYANVFTTGLLNRANIPVIMETDREAIAGAVRLLHLDGSRLARVVRIRNTLELGHIQVSEPLCDEARAHRDVTVLGEPEPMCFDGEGNLV